MTLQVNGHIADRIASALGGTVTRATNAQRDIAWLSAAAKLPNGELEHAWVQGSITLDGLGSGTRIVKLPDTSDAARIAETVSDASKAADGAYMVATRRRGHLYVHPVKIGYTDTGGQGWVGSTRNLDSVREAAADYRPGVGAEVKVHVDRDAARDAGVVALGDSTKVHTLPRYDVFSS